MDEKPTCGSTWISKPRLFPFSHQPTEHRLGKEPSAQRVAQTPGLGMQPCQEDLCTVGSPTPRPGGS